MGSGSCYLVSTQTTVMMMVVTMLLLLFVSGKGVTGVKVCPATDSSLTVKDSGLLLVPASENVVAFDVLSERCGVDDHFELHFKEQRLYPKTIVDDEGREWFQIRFTLMRGKFYVVVEGLNPFYIPGKQRITKYCGQPYKYYTVISNTSFHLAKLCTDGGILEDYLGRSQEDDFKDKTSNHDFKKLFDLENDDRDYRSSFRGGHIIFIPVGAIIFLLSVCLRCCLCRRKKVIQRVRTITVVRRVPVPTSSDFIHVVGEPSSPDPMDLPPSYADIENELPPPAYSELENVGGDVEAGADAHVGVPPSSEESPDVNLAPPTAPIADASTNQPIQPSTESSISLDNVDGDLSERDTRSTLTRVLTNRSLKSQFSFKPMKEEE